MNSKDFNNDAEREGAADSTSAPGLSADQLWGPGAQRRAARTLTGKTARALTARPALRRRPGQTFQGTGYQAPGHQNGPAFQGADHQGPGYHSNPGTYGQSGMDRFFNSIRAMNLYRAQPRVLGGVCSGISQRYGIDMTPGAHLVYSCRPAWFWRFPLRPGLGFPARG